MGEHKTKKSKLIIEALEYLGNTLNYKVDVEHRIQKDKLGSQSIDVAWFIDEYSDYPIMIFEIESNSYNYVVNNPAKIYGKNTKNFEKPLFFFHIFIECGSDTEKIKDLEELFGKHNYKTYKLSAGDSSQLLIDILSQHRRISQRFNLSLLLEAMNDHSYFWSKISLSTVLDFIEKKIHYSEESILLPVYALLSNRSSFYKERFIQVLKEREKMSFNKEDNYDTYCGNTWAYPIYIGILSYISNEEDKRNKYFSLFKEWQESSSYMSMIGPHFGLSKDYDGFIIGLSGALLALIGCLMKDTKGAINYIVNQGMLIIKKLEDSDFKYSFYNALWLLHISSFSEEFRDGYDYIRNFINRNGGINEKFIYSPPNIFFNDDENEIVELLGTDKKLIPNLDRFKEDIEKINASKIIDIDVIDLALKVLSDENTIYHWTEYLTYFLKHY